MEKELKNRLKKKQGGIIMNEKLKEALKRVKIRCHPKVVWDDPIDTDLEIIEQALKELQAIKNSNPSEALDWFRGFKNGMITDNAICITKSYFDDKFPIIENALLKAQKNQKEFGCLLEIVLKAVKQATFKGLYFDTTDTDGFKRKGFIKCYLDYDGFTNKFFWNTGWNGDVWLSSYKKTWWLKENKEE